MFSEVLIQLQLSTIILGIASICSLLFVKFFIPRNAKENPKWLNGPRTLPLIGAGIQIAWLAATRTLNDTVKELGARYGDICGVFGSRNNYFVFVTGAEMAKKILKNPNFEGKFPQSSWDSLLYRKPNLGILHSFGSTNTELRSRTISKLRKYGHGDPKFPELLTSLVQRTIRKWESDLQNQDAGQAQTVILIDKYFCMEEMMDMMWTILIGTPFPGDHALFRKFVDNAEFSLNEKVKQFVILYAYKIARFIPYLTVYQPTKAWFEETEELIKKIIHNRRLAFKNIEANLLDSFLCDIDNKVHQDVTEEQLIWILNDLHLVGVTGLASSSLQWGILFLCLNPTVMDKFVEEIDSVIGSERSPTIEDRPRMPYTESVILETIRMGNVVNYAMRSNLNDITFEGYFIPKETLVMVDTECLRKDPQIWEDPNIFRPERFYSAETQSVVNTDKLNAFGFKRPCLGENIVKQSNFIFLTNLFQKYKIQLKLNSPIPSIESKSGLIGGPNPFHIKVARATRHM